MAKSLLLEAPALSERLRTRFVRQRAAWLRGEGSWPLSLNLGVPSEAEAMAHPDKVSCWLQGWQAWPGPGRVVWVERRWPRLGAQHLPRAVVFDAPPMVTEMLGVLPQWQRAVERLQRIVGRWPALAATASQQWDVLGEWEEADFERLVGLVDWLHSHPGSDLLLRQLPVPGVDGKWLERHRRPVTSWLAALQGGDARARDLYQLAGLRRAPPRIRFRVLDPQLRARFAGLSDIEAPLSDIAAISLPLRHVFIVENLQTGLAFGDLPGAVVFMKQGYAVEAFAGIPWLESLPVHYWGDLDTNGFAILDRLRIDHPAAHSLLMDEETLLRHRQLWGHEAKPAQALELPGLNSEEKALYQALRSGRWGPGVRLEQERIDWQYAWDRILEVSANGHDSQHLAASRNAASASARDP